MLKFAIAASAAVTLPSVAFAQQPSHSAMPEPKMLEDGRRREADKDGALCSTWEKAGSWTGPYPFSSARATASSPRKSGRRWART